LEGISNHLILLYYPERTKIGTIGEKGKYMDEKNQITNVRDVAPTTFKHIIGQNAVVKTLDTAIRAYFNDRMAGKNPYTDNVIMVGPPGVGKTACASVLHKSYGFPDNKFQEVIGVSLGINDLNDLLISADADTTIYIDEAMGLSEQCAQVLLKSLDENVLIIGKKNGSKKITKIPLDNFLCILSLTDEYKLPAPLRQRFPLYCRFDYYDDLSMQKIIEQRALSCGWKIEDPDVILPILSSKSQNTPRRGLQLLQGCWRVNRSYDEEVIKIEHVREAIELAQLDSKGCDFLQQSYLRILNRYNKPVRLNIIASSLGLPARTISAVVEEWLIRARLIEKYPDGRALSDEGKAHALENGL